MIDRVVILNDIAQPKGGATALALLSAYQLRARGLAVTMLVGDAGDNPALTQAGVEVVALGQERLGQAGVAGLAAGLYNRAAGAMVQRWIDANDTPGTVYHLHGWAQILSPAVFRALKRVEERVVLHAHDFFLACPNGSYAFLRTGQVCPLTPMSPACVSANCDRRNYGHKLWRVARQGVQRRFYDRHGSPPVLAIHEGMRPFLMRAGIPSASIHAVPNPVTPWSDTRIEAESNRQVLFVGRLEETKGPDLAAAAARAAGATITFVGDGVLRERLQAEYPEMHFLGRRTPEQIREIARTARLLVMPSRYPEPFGLVATEALWSGLPVVTTDTALLAEDIVTAGAGLAVEPRDTARFAAALRAILDDDDRCRAMSEAAFAGTRSLALSPEGWTDRLIDTYRGRLAGDV
ncbi:glycosyltransferase family 4 protein [Sphingomonas aracearum]|uniref:Glycosyltransferase n=1 Tax=Sphingomonas aracearum TaxID=2283317 RepID=A0A369VSC4_9SPHN|nr:glycosyltransferase family 4 protein [Sphingomonas aracearum]RDE05294.1 glycosyltransferase [Sphingomonas aracearum]